jgi:ABC-type uncharacterized transport system fused permease/ATPase subunit
MEERELTSKSTEIATESNMVQFHDVSFGTPTGQLLAKDLNFTVQSGRSMLIMGPSGCGKSSILRVLAGLWPIEKGTITKPMDGSVFFLPQIPYMVLGSLKDQFTYPRRLSSSDTDDMKELRELLRIVELERILDNLP